jgi:hypothetical protein
MGCVHEWGCDECDRVENLVECLSCFCLGDFVRLCGTCREEFRAENGLGYDEWKGLNPTVKMSLMFDSITQAGPEVREYYKKLIAKSTKGKA